MNVYETASEVLAKRMKMHTELTTFERRLKDYDGVTLPQFALLIYAGDASHNMSTLAATLGTTKCNLTGLCDRLEKKGLIERNRSTEDRRVITLTVTPAGLALINKTKTTVA